MQLPHLGLFAGCLAFAEFMTAFSKGTVFELPTFVWALAGGVILRNVLEGIFKVQIFDRAIDVFGNCFIVACTWRWHCCH